jgi:hypothetical protein
MAGTETELIPLVVLGSPPAISKVKLQYGHYVSPGIAKHHGPTTPFYSPLAELQTKLSSETADLNPPPPRYE